MKYSKWKSFFDIFFALLLLSISSPLMLLISVVIKLSDREGPVIFKQTRIGKNVKPFTLYKFRSMKGELSKDGIELTDTERMFRAGRLIRKMSLDELPQLLNILKGNMSFIGPRPLPKEYLPYYTVQENRRHSIKPGISGWAQVNGRNNIDWEEKFELDVYYTENMSLSFDLKILLLTVKKVFLGSDVIEFNPESMMEFSDYRLIQKNVNE